MHLAHEYDLTPELLAVTHVWSVGANVEEFEVAVKGAPETVIDLCRLDAGARAHLLERVGSHAAQGLRTLGVARAMHRGAMPASPRAFSLQFLGFVCLADPLRASVPAALDECSQAGIRVVMITGDHPATALAIARQAGLDVGTGVLSGRDVDNLSDAELRDRVRSVRVCARAKPTHKLRLVQALAANGEVVAMTGDGVNDAPALKAAHVGVAMGGRGTDVAREAAGLVLVSDDFASLVTAVRMGRRIYDNIGHAMQYLLSVHIPIAGLGLLPVLLGWPLLLTPVHVVFLQFVIDPACALVFEADHEADDVMQRPPRRDAPMFSAAMLKRSSVLGIVALMIVLTIYGAALTLVEEPIARALGFSSLTWSSLALIFVSRARTKRMLAVAFERNAVFWWILFLTAAALVIALYWSPLTGVFHFAAPTIEATTAVAVVTTVGVLLAGFLVRVRRKAA
jgi:Ca2+-transporting ATPase